MRRLVIGVALALVAGCGSDNSPTSPTAASVAGTWTLQTLGGEALPATILQAGANKLEVMSDVVNVAESGSFTQLTQFRMTQSGQTTTSSAALAGSWSLSGNDVTFNFNGTSTTGTGTLSGNTLTVTDDGLAYVYKKQ